MRDYCQLTPLIIERGKGSYLYDIEGRRYLDGVSSLWVLFTAPEKADRYRHYPAGE